MHIITLPRRGNNKNAFNKDNISNLPTDDLDQIFCSTTLDSNKSLWLEWHDKLGHPPDRDLQALTHVCVIPKAVSKSKKPICFYYLFGAMHKRPWRTKGKSKTSIKKANETNPGDNTSTDTMTFSVDGLLPYMSVFLTSLPFTAITVLVDH